jgi:formate dehydrogenase gamma subunit
MKFIKFALLILVTLLWLTASGWGQSDDETCLSCHDDVDITGLNHLDEEVSMFISGDTLELSVHAGMACIDCHIDLENVDDYPHEDVLEHVDCSGCHDDVAEIYYSSAHGQALEKQNPATCASCHGSHKILSHTDAEALTSAENLPYICSSCHHKVYLAEDPDIRIVDPFDRYMKGIHAEGIARGIGSAASCDDCHGIHDLKRATDPSSRVHKLNIPSTCSKCHNDIFIKYSRGIHGKALSAGIQKSPNCADCHGEHEILEIANPDSPVNFANLSDYVCGRCHNDPVIVEKFGLGTDRFTSYQDTYHGLAISGGSVKAATCASCHKAHDILPASNPASSIHENNLVNTCQKCHIDANLAFSTSYTHKSTYSEYDNINDIVATIYIILIVIVIGGMLAHNLIILARYMIEKKRMLKMKESVRRFNGNMIFQHMVITITFIVLVITGFALRYPDGWVVSIMKFFGIFENSRGIIHRVAAVGMIYISVHHLLFLIFSKRGKFHLRELWPTKDDLVQIKQNILFYLNLSKERPKFGFYDYTEKAEYWALVWGTLIMAVTGFVLWFPTFFTTFLPAWIVQMSETIHFYEAWLATLAIAVFHFFFVIFHPDQYPMSYTWLNGKMTMDEVEHHHPKWYEELKEEKEKENKGGESETPKKPETIL